MNIDVIITELRKDISFLQERIKGMEDGIKEMMGLLKDHIKEQQRYNNEIERHDSELSMLTKTVNDIKIIVERHQLRFNEIDVINKSKFDWKSFLLSNWWKIGSVLTAIFVIIIQYHVDKLLLK